MSGGYYNPHFTHEKTGSGRLAGWHHGVSGGSSAPSRFSRYHLRSLSARRGLRSGGNRKTFNSHAPAVSSRVRCRLLGWSVREVDPAPLGEFCKRVLIGAARQLCFRVSLPFPRLSGAGQQSAGKTASTPPPPHAGGREGAHSKMGRVCACARARARLSLTHLPVFGKPTNLPL